VLSRGGTGGASTDEQRVKMQSVKEKGKRIMLAWIPTRRSPCPWKGDQLCTAERNQATINASTASTSSYLRHVAGGVRARRGGAAEVAGCRQEGRARGAMGMAERNNGAEEVGGVRTGEKQWWRAGAGEEEKL